MKITDKIEYKSLAVLYFIITFTFVGFAIVSLVHGIKVQFEGNTLLGFLLYFAAPLLIFISYLTYQKAHYKLRIIALARK